MDMLSISSSQARVPFCFKSTTIVHLTQDLKSSLYEEFLALTPKAMKCFKRLVMNQIKSYLPTDLDPIHPVSPHSDS